MRAHHERIDGRGYPDGLSGDEIPAVARIVAVAEAYDTLTAEDTYRTRMTLVRGAHRAAPRRRAPARRRATSRSSRGCSPAAASTTATPTRADFDRELAIEERIANSIAPAGAEPAA